MLCSISFFLFILSKPEFPLSFSSILREAGQSKKRKPIRYNIYWGSTQKAEAGWKAVGAKPDQPAQDLVFKMEKGRREEAGRGHSERGSTKKETSGSGVKAKCPKSSTQGRGSKFRKDTWRVFIPVPVSET